MREEDQAGIRRRKPERGCEPLAVVVPGDLLAAPAPPLAQEVPNPRRDVLRGEGEAEAREHGVGRLEPLKLHLDFSRVCVVRDGYAAAVGGVGVCDGVDGGHGWEGRWRGVYMEALVGLVMVSSFHCSVVMYDIFVYDSVG